MDTIDDLRQLLKFKDYHWSGPVVVGPLEYKYIHTRGGYTPPEGQEDWTPVSNKQILLYMAFKFGARPEGVRLTSLALDYPEKVTTYLPTKVVKEWNRVGMLVSGKEFIRFYVDMMGD